MKYTETPDCDYRLIRKVEADDPQAFIEFLEEVAGETPVAWYSHKDEMAHPGVWVRRGQYRLKHGSFVDPTDLSAYPAQYYEPFASGRHEAVQIGRTPERMAMPADVTATATAGELAEAIRTLTPEFTPAEADAEAVEVAEAVEEPEAAETPKAAVELKFLQPDYAFEFHGALTRGWHGQYYVATGEGDEVVAELLVLR